MKRVCVADCSPLHSLGQTEAATVDVRIRGNVWGLYLGGTSVSTVDVTRFLRGRYGRWAGYLQLYQLHHAWKTRLA